MVNTRDVEWSLDFLEAVSTGNDTFNVNGSSIRNLSGDIYSLRFNAVLVGANDTFNGATSTFASVYGDAVVALSANSVTGGDDTFNGAFNFAIGDVGTVSGTQFFGGADTFTDLAGATLSNPHLWGDVIDLENTTAPSSGGNDIFTFDSVGAFMIYADASNITNTSNFIAGADSITISSALGTELYGDAKSIRDSSNVTFGNDTFVLQASYTPFHRIFGDTKTLREQ